VLGLAGGAVVLAVRIRRRRTTPAAGADPPISTAPAPRPDPLALAGVVAVAAVFAPTFNWLYAQYTKSLWLNVHGVFVPLFVFLLARSALRRDPAPARPEASPWGLLLVAIGLVLAVVDAGVRSRYLGAVGLVVCVPGLSLCLLGARRTRSIAAPLALSAFALPMPAVLEGRLGLTSITAATSHVAIDWLGIAVLRHETLFLTQNGPINVGQNCNGLSTFYAGAALAFVLAYAARGPRRVLIPLLVYPLTVLSNTVRLTGIVAITHRSGMEFLQTPLHGLSGLLVLWFVLACLWLCADHRGLREVLS
jgi:exosortase